MFRSRLVWLLSGVLAAVGMVVLAQVPISGLPNAGTQTGSEYIPEVQGGTTVKTTSGALAAFAASAANPTGEVGPTAVNGAASTYMRSDAAPAFNESAAYTQTGIWQLNAAFGLVMNGGSGSTNGQGLITYYDANSGHREWYAGAGVGSAGNFGIYDETATALRFEVTSAGLTEISDSAGNLFNAGYLGTPDEVKSANYTVAAIDAGKLIEYDSSGFTLSIPCASLGPGFVFTVLLADTGSTLTLTASSGTLVWTNGALTTGNRTFTDYAMGTIAIGSAGNCMLTGSGISGLIDPLSLKRWRSIEAANDESMRYAA